jgi:hypothetical protein
VTAPPRFDTLAPVGTKEIRTAQAAVDLSCDVCGRTLLRGERAHPYLERGQQRLVCELCTTRAQQEGWTREGTVPAYDGAAAASERRGSLLSRLRRLRDRSAAGQQGAEAGVDAHGPGRSPAGGMRSALGGWPARTGRSAPPRSPAGGVGSAQGRPPPPVPPPSVREARNVRAIPTSPEQRIVSAIEAFNRSEHPRTVAGVARSLGLPIVSVRPVASPPSAVQLTVAWELYWYRYEFDLADEDAGVRVVDQGQELGELSEVEREPNAVCVEDGVLAAAG